MNKYYEAFEMIKRLVLLSKWYCDKENEFYKKYNANLLETLQELVDKATPKKISARIFEYQSDDDFEILCPNCNEVIMTREEYENYAKPNYCCYCGQSLDWREDE